jgi:glycosyltransferase involved in cell wall biosynthesis
MNLPGKENKLQPLLPLAYVGSTVPDEPTFHNVAFSRAGNMFQENLLVALARAQLPASLILSQRPTRSFPHSPKLWVRGGQAHLQSGFYVELIPFINLPVLRPLSVGLFVLVRLICWGWAHRHARHRLVYAFNLTEPPGVSTWLAAKFIRAKAVASITDVNVPGQTVPPTWQRRLDFWLHKRLIPFFDGLIVVSKRIIEDFRTSKPYLRVEGGMNVGVLKRLAARSISGRCSSLFTIVSAGSLDEANGILEILAALLLLPGEGFRLRIAGAGPLADRVKEATLIDSRIEYVGYLSFAEVLELYETADLLVNMRLTRRVYTEYFFPSKLIEYLATGTPVITTCTGHIEEQFAEMAFLLREETPRALAELICQIASMEPERRAEKGRAAREYIRQNYSWDVHGCRIAEFFQNQIFKSNYTDKT